MTKVNTDGVGRTEMTQGSNEALEPLPLPEGMEPNQRTLREMVRGEIDTLQPLQGDTWDREGQPPVNWLIRKWLPSGRLSVLHGEVGAGKSWVALQVVAALMHGGAPLAALDGIPEKVRRQAGDLCTMQEGGLRVLWLTWSEASEDVLERWGVLRQEGAIRADMPDPDLFTLVDMRKAGPLWVLSDKWSENCWTETGRRFLATLRGHAVAVIDPAEMAVQEEWQGYIRPDERALAERHVTVAMDNAAREAGCAVLLIGSERWQGIGRSSILLRHVNSRREGSPAWRLECRSNCGDAGMVIDLARCRTDARAWFATLPKLPDSEGGPTGEVVDADFLFQKAARRLDVPGQGAGRQQRKTLLQFFTSLAKERAEH